MPTSSASWLQRVFNKSLPYSLTLFAMIIVVLWSGAALALDQVRLGKAVPNSFAFGAAEVGIEANIFEHEGLEVSDHELSRRRAAAAGACGRQPRCRARLGPGTGFPREGGAGHRRCGHVWTPREPGAGPAC